MKMYKFRMKHGLSKNAFARMVTGGKMLDISGYENGNVKPTKETLEAIARAMGITYENLMSEKKQIRYGEMELCKTCTYWKRAGSIGGDLMACHCFLEAKKRNGADWENGTCSTWTSRMPKRRTPFNNPKTYIY